MIDFTGPNVGFKIPRWQRRAGSIPAPGTIQIKHLANKSPFSDFCHSAKWRQNGDSFFATTHLSPLLHLV
jgi:hypothetical protein